MTDKTDNSLHEALSALVDGECSGSELDELLNALGEENSELYIAQAANAERGNGEHAHLTGSACMSESGLSEHTLRESWKRIHLAKSVSQNAEVNPQIDLSLAIAKAIANEDTPKIEKISDGAGKWFTWKPVRDFAGKTAIAASVAFAFVAGVQFINPATNDVDQTIVAEQDTQKASGAQQLPGAGVPQGFELPPLSARTVSAGDVSDSNRAARISPISVNNGLPSGAVVIRNAEMDEYVNRLLYKHAEQSASVSALGVIPYARVSDIEAAEEHHGEADEGIDRVENPAGMAYPNQAKSEFSGESSGESIKEN